MSTVIRLKRRLEEEPLNAFIINCKRRKTDENFDLSTVLTFAGTLKNEEDIFTHLKTSSKEVLEEEFKRHNSSIGVKLRAQNKQDSKNSRYKIVNCFRSHGLNSDEMCEKGNNAEYIVYDLESENHEDEALSKEDSTQYVYDLYRTISDDLCDAYLENYVSMYPYSGDLTYGSMKDNGVNEANSDDDSEDSNAESNWKNDYPDESDMESVKEDTMLEAMQRCDLSDLSSDDEEEGFVYSVDSEAVGFEENVDDSDVQRYGERYARFKARHKKEIPTSDINPLYYGDIDEEEYYY